jgi:DNA invertase Pin-like site-specific DNA recombinase
LTAYGYVRVSTDRQDTGSDAQRRALEDAGCTEIVEERASGRKARPSLAKLVDQLAPGDTLTVYRFDRISRSVADFYAIGAKIADRGASLRSVSEKFDTSTPAGKAMMGFAAIWAELEADTIRERVNNGLKAARARGVVAGRRRTIDDATGQKIVKRLEAGEHYEELAREYRVSGRTILRTNRRYGQRPLPLDLAS